MVYVLFCSEWLSMQFINLVKQYNIQRDLDHMVISFLLYTLCICICYLLSVILTFILTLQMMHYIFENEEGRWLSDCDECIWAFWRCDFLIESFLLILTVPFGSVCIRGPLSMKLCIHMYHTIYIYIELFVYL